ncbi:MAG TPA: hypothetical protein VFB66_03260 [Tepidisphaeraceae bacterium]|nr:hypothetical protein [Tepidisphaeraceae bacterium]
MKQRPIRNATILLALLSLFCGGTFAAEEKKDAVLDRPLPKVDLVDVTVRDVVDFLQDVSGKKLDWKAMQDAGIDPATSVTFQVEKTTFGKAVKRLFVIAGADAEPEVVVDPKGTVVVKPAAKRK